MGLWMGSFFSELKRRKVLRVVAAYVVSSWVLLQVADLFTDILALPDWAPKLVLLILVVGFVPALILSWAFDVTPDGVQGEGGESGKGPVVLSLLVVLLGLAAGGWWYSGMDARWARNSGMDEIEILVADGNIDAAYALARRVEELLPDEPEMDEIWQSFSWRTSIITDPDGAQVYWRSYEKPEAVWQNLGMSPLHDIHVPFGASVLRFEAQGYSPLTRVIGGGMTTMVDLLIQEVPDADFGLVNPERFRLETEEIVPDRMVRVPQGTTTIDGELVSFRSFYLDKYEVTNEEFQAFVDAGGYERRDLWEHEFLIGNGPLAFDEATARFIDSSGRPGPSTWAAGTYPDGEGDFPVAGVSWYEAAAYARYVGKELPTIHHWRRAYAGALLAWELPASNANRDGLARVGEFSGIGWTGTYDMLGNVREWCYNATSDGQRVIVGGAWNDSLYMVQESFSNPSRVPAFDRTPTNGIRLAKISDEGRVREATRQSIADEEVIPLGDPVSDEVFKAKLSDFDYDHSPLNPELRESVEFRYWTRELVEIDTSDGTGRIPIYLYLPKRESSRHQALVYWPGAAPQYFESLETTRFQLDFVLRNGRAVVMPVLKGMYGRKLQVLPNWNTHTGRDLAIQQVREFRRTIDYLETRPDIESDNLGYTGFSWGGRVGAIVLAVDSRFKVGVLNQAGINARNHPDINVVNFLPRVTTPVLHFSGRYDTDFLFDASSKPFFERLGTPAEDKKHVVEPTGHFVSPAVVSGETLDWLDKYLGPVE